MFRLKLPCAQCLAVSVKLSIVIISIHYPPTFVLTCCHHLLEPWPKLAGLFSVATGARQLSRKWNLIATCSQCGSQRCTFVVLKSLIAHSVLEKTRTGSSFNLKIFKDEFWEFFGFQAF
jgi:hypothetical protein